MAFFSQFFTYLLKFFTYLLAAFAREKEKIMEPPNPTQTKKHELSDNQLTHQTSRRGADQSDEPTPLPYLGPELFFEILTRLPVKSLLRFRSVCKEWRSLISSPMFVRAHMTLCAKNNESHHLILYSDTRGSSELKYCPLYSISNETDPIKARDLHNPFSDIGQDSVILIVGSCNGLVCVTIGPERREQHDLYLWNPSTRDCKKLDKPNVPLYRFGFGYDKASDDHKVVGLFSSRFDKVFKNQVWVYSVKAGAWRKTHDFPDVEISADDGVYADGALYWAAKRHGTLGKLTLILSLNLTEETYRELALPSYGVSNSSTFTLDLGALEGSLMALCSYSNHIDVWLVDEDCGTKYWIEPVRIPYLLGDVDYGYSAPLCVSDKGVIVMKTKQCILLHNLKDKTQRNCEVHNVTIYRYLLAATFTESLVSPKAEIEQHVL